MSKKRYHVNIIDNTVGYYTIEADSASEAEEQAMDMFAQGVLPSGMDSDISTGDVQCLGCTNEVIATHEGDKGCTCKN